MADLRIPDLGDGVEEGVVIATLVAAGDKVVAGQSVLEIETDKVTLEIPAPRAGVIYELCVEVDAIVRPGDVVLRLVDDDAPAIAPAAINAAAPSKATLEHAGNPERVAPAIETGGANENASSSATRLVAAGPSARREARQLGIDIAVVQGSGSRGRIKADDVRKHVRQRMHAVPAGESTPAHVELPDLALFGPTRREPLTRLEQVTARNLKRAATVVPHAWVEHRADITELEHARRKLRGSQAAAAPRITLSAIVCKVVAAALTEFPRFNAAFDEVRQEIVYRDYCNIGVAVDTGKGLLVPVIRDVDSLSILAIATELERLSVAARENRLEPAALRGGGITISNLGALGVSAIQPLVNWPEAAIIGVAALQSTVVSADYGFATRLRLPLTLGFDHRLINGADAARFLSHVGALLAEPMQLAVTL